GRRISVPQLGKFVRISDLKNDKVDFKLDVSAVKETELTRPGIQLIDESCLLLAVRWKTLKPTFFEYEGDPIYLSQDILSYKVDNSVIDTAYLINELQSDYVIDQLNSFRMGSTIPFLRRVDLLEIIIKVPFLDSKLIKVSSSSAV